jgi:hypothetical protein
MLLLNHKLCSQLYNYFSLPTSNSGTLQKYMLVSPSPLTKEAEWFLYYSATSIFQVFLHAFHSTLVFYMVTKYQGNPP